MIKTVFFLRFSSQLRRTRPEIIQRIEGTIKKAIEKAGGTISGGRQCISAVYDEQNMGFWLDMLMLAETAHSVLEEAKSELYGYTLLIAGDLPERPESLYRPLSMGPQGGGIFLDQKAQESLEPYVICEQFLKWPSPRRFVMAGKNSPENFVRVKEFRNLLSEPAQFFPFREIILSSLKQARKNNALVIGPAASGKREGVYRYCRELSRDFPQLSIRFGTGGLNAVIDTWTEQLRKLAANSNRITPNTVTEINRLWRFLFQQRLRGEISPFMVQNGRRLFSLLLEIYATLAKQHNAVPILVLENIHEAEEASAIILEDALNTRTTPQGLLVFGTCDNEITESKLKNWETLFPKVVNLTGDTGTAPSLQIPQELREVVYALSLFNKCFPAFMFRQLMEEEGKNPDMIVRALSILYSWGIIDSVADPRLRTGRIPAETESIQREKKDLIRSMICSRLLSWVKHGDLNPCFNLLAILADPDRGERPDDELIIKSLYSDLVNGTVKEIEKAINSELLGAIAGKDQSAIIIYIYKTMRALLTGTETDIKTAFMDTAHASSSFPVLKAQVLANHSAYQLSIRNTKPALDSIKESILFSQGKNSFCLAQSYRLFSLVNLSRQQVSETNEYLNFAMDNAEKSGNGHELGISAYYAAASSFLFGNVANAMRLARKAREQAFTSGLPEWADRSSFLEGRLFFEIGLYQEALDILENLLMNPSGASTSEKDRLLAAWIYRISVYHNNPLVPKPEDSGCDADLFEMEAAYLAGDFRKTIELANALSTPRIDENFIFTEQPDWRSGFSQCELLYFSQEEIWKRMVCAYHSLALCRISPEDGEEAVQNIQRILREEHLSEMDPWDAFYFYAWHNILEHTAAEQIDKNTAISLAFKRLQRRASRIDDIETRRQFLSRPRWNGELSCAAKEFKLI